MNDSLKQWFNQWDWIILILLTAYLVFYSWWWILGTLILWTCWKVYLNWQEYDMATTNIALMIRAMRQAKFVWRKNK